MKQPNRIQRRSALLRGLLVLGILSCSPRESDHRASAETPPQDLSVIRISTEEYPPFTSSDLRDYGMAAAIVTRAFALRGIRTEYQFYPASRSYNTAKAGLSDATLPWIRTADREKEFHYPDAPVISAGTDRFYFRRDTAFSWDPANPDYGDLTGYKFTAISGFTYEEPFQKAEEEGLIEVLRVPTIKQGFLTVLNRRTDIFIIKDPIGSFVLKESLTEEEQAQLKRMKRTNQPITNYYLLVSREIENPGHYLNQFSLGLNQLKTSGEYDKIIKDFTR